MTQRALYLFLTASAGLVAFFGWKLTARGAYESAEYEVIESDGEFEIREYPELMLATTRSEFNKQGDDGSFMRLFRYIRGANEAQQKIAMTTPVFMNPETEKSQDGSMSFVIPRNVAAEGTPAPESEAVSIHQRAAGRFAVIRFAGRLTSESAADAERRLRQWMSQRDLTATGDVETAGYDPPWTPAPLRRNEILIRINMPQ